MDIQAHDRRITALENWRNVVEKTELLKENLDKERHETNLARFNQLEASNVKQTAAINKLLAGVDLIKWLVSLGIAAGGGDMLVHLMKGF